MNEEIWLDPSADEARASRGTMSLSCMPALGVITNVWQTGQMSTEEALQVPTIAHNFHFRTL